MATKAVNAKSKKLEARVPHAIADAVENLKEAGESTGQFIVSALEGEIKRRQRRKAKESE
ncbi:YlcI/YnfO family protein [Escherichia coli]|uniref:YlcI/YnfO family protein n=1 Tax=Escherichia coli TaxID=562 RepID=UPI001FCF0EE6|nr:YlcI/YnfO family protein [Escherichia coli]